MPMPLGRLPRATWPFLIAGALCLSLPATAQAQACDQALETADGFYVRAAFDEAINLLITCLENGQLSGEERARAYRLVGLSYIGKGQMEEARHAASELMAIQPDYEPDPVNDPPDWQRLVDEAEPAQTAAPDPPPADADRSDPSPQRDPITPPPTSSSLGPLFVQIHFNSSAIVDEEEDSGAGGGFGLKLGFPLIPALILFGGFDTAGIDLEDDTPDLDYRLTVLDLGAQFNLGAGRRSFVPYLTAAYSRQSFTADVDLDDPTFTGSGFTVGLGAMYLFTPQIGLNANLDLTFGSLRLTEDDESFRTGTGRFMLGLSWFPLR